MTTTPQSPKETGHPTQHNHAQNRGVEPSDRAKGGNWDWALDSLIKVSLYADFIWVVDSIRYCLYCML